MWGFLRDHSIWTWNWGQSGIHYWCDIETECQMKENLKSKNTEWRITLLSWTSFVTDFYCSWELNCFTLTCEWMDRLILKFMKITPLEIAPYSIYFLSLTYQHGGHTNIWDGDSTSSFLMWGSVILCIHRSKPRIWPWGSVALTVQHLCPQKFALISSASGGHLVGIVCSRTKATKFSFLFYLFIYLFIGL
jgi:hypothetical protein